MRFPPLEVFGGFPPGLYKAAVPTPGNRQYENPDTHKGHPDFHVEVAGFEPAAFWSRTKDLVRFSGFCRKLPEISVFPGLYPSL